MKSVVIARLAELIVTSFLLMISVSSYAEDPLALPNLLPVSDIETSSIDEKDVSRFTNSIAIINQFYVKTTDEKKLFENAIRGIVAGLDPHSEYLDEKAYKAFLLKDANNLSSVGLEVTSEYDVLKVISALDDTPAFKAGILPGDYIVAINNQLVSNMSLDDAIGHMHGQKDSQINLTILRKGEDKPLSYTLKRENIPTESVKSKILDNGFAYVRISQFKENTASQMVDAINKMNTDEKLKGLVLDLRNNASGSVSSATKVVNVLLESANIQSYKKIIAYTKGHLSNVQTEYKANSSDVLQGMPIIVLINQGTSSAAEIVAGALQDYHRATIIGVNSFGKGSLQTIIPIDKTHALKLTTALYLTPSGRQIQDEGIKPDVVVENLKVTTNLDSSVMGPIREYQLANRLLSKDVKAKRSIVSEDFSDLAQQDFQLYQALKMLQVLSNLNSKMLVKN